ncbi:hypothetical protein AMECASPLE_021536 [Ameca splendens]|uniref:Secreted protein n=1 Tax=Ameca splendens TaxID=208324 RepID=A0ABV0Z1M5_9TELE
MQKPSVIPELTLAVTAAATWVAQKVARTCVLPVSAGLLHTSKVSRKDNREMTAPCPSSLCFCLQYTMCHAVVGGCHCIERADYSFTMSYSAFHPWYVSVLVHRAC